MKIFIIGYMASGKSRFGKRLASKLKFDFFDLDLYIQDKSLKTSAEWIRESGEEAFREIESKMLKECAAQKEDLVIASGGGTPCFFDNMKWMKQNGKTLWLNIPPEHIFQRLQTQKGDRPMIPLKNALPDKEAFLLHLEERKKYYSQADLILDKADVSLAQYILAK